MKKDSLLQVLQVALFAGVYAGLLVVFGFRWGHLLVDTFRDQWVFARLAGGAVLYRDVFYLYGLFPPYAAAFLYRCLGPDMLWIMGLGLVISIVTATALYRVGRLFLNRLLSTLLTLIFLAVFAFGDHDALPVFNFILPYSLASTFFIMFIMLALYAFVEYILRERHPILLLWWGVWMTLALLSRPDLGLGLWIVFALVGVFFLSPRFAPRRCAALISPLAISAAVYAVFLSATHAWEGFMLSCWGVFGRALGGRSSFAIHCAGLDNPGLVVRSLFSLLATLALAFILYLICVLLVRRRAAEQTPGRGPGAIEWAAAVLAVPLFFWHVAATVAPGQYACVPLMLLGGVLFYAIKTLRSKESEMHKSAACLLLFVVASVMVLRIAFRTGPGFYGFFSMVPALVAYVIVLDRLPAAAFARLAPDPVRAHGLYRGCLAILLLTLSLPPVVSSVRAARARTHAVYVSGHLRMYADENPVTEYMLAAADYLRAQQPARRTLAVLPEGVALNLLAGYENPTPYHTLLPEQVALVGEDRIIGAMERAGIYYVVLVHRPAFEYGQARIGLDYGRDLVGWMLSEYRLVKTFGPHPFTSDEFGVAVYERVSGAVRE
ncbi:MAG: hypothetical protein KJ626_11085 [Verrucomicrobia bacterium]|nr:hypothetical protein [Verrucomicrobiota bacterium]